MNYETSKSNKIEQFHYKGSSHQNRPKISPFVAAHRSPRRIPTSPPRSPWLPSAPARRRRPRPRHVEARRSGGGRAWLVWETGGLGQECRGKNIFLFAKTNQKPGRVCYSLLVGWNKDCISMYLLCGCCISFVSLGDIETPL